MQQIWRIGRLVGNFGPGDPMFAHKQDEHVPVAQIERCERELRSWLEAR